MAILKVTTLGFKDLGEDAVELNTVFNNNAKIDNIKVRRVTGAAYRVGEEKKMLTRMKLY